ncbi:hypothetical protein [Halodesulfovibrio marinisediminis]|uniref:Uncharacterized protein n=1 Tax=Halodesulfovibrio marinisediminis DSM 17456 TaxID=1121457 RepID=A0A1N6HZZ2_9BACT|nr:hypothetical protein [Halodesulfovibrio marinisediminis]SIO25384.1 hypothetical protein SAMN02745161_2313 [Halodesulfovibrio marinisediminis DSM 17456]
MATTTKVRPKVDKVIIGKKMPLNNEDIHLIEESRKEKEALPENERLARFDNIIHRSGWCGFANGGQVDYILNTNPRKTYNVTVNIDWRRGIENGFFTETHVVPAGGKVMLGCTQTNNIPVTKYHRRVVGEV